MTAESEKTLKKAEAKIYSALCESGYSHEEAWAVMYDYRGVSALQIAEKAVGEETEIHGWVRQRILSRIKTKTGGTE